MGEVAKPLYFPSGDQTLFGWLHAPQGAAKSGFGVVVCPPFGYEAICAHRSIRAFADTCAAAGLPALRFDYTGTGDSSDSEGEEDQIAAWCADIEAAVATFTRVAGVQRVCILGVRLGALLAGMVAARSEIDAVIAVAPVASGRRYLRELRAFQATANTVPGFVPDAGNAQASAEDQGLEITGFRLSAASVRTLESLDLSKLRQGPRTSALILDREDLPSAKAWATSLSAAGVTVSYEPLPGFTDMVSTPHAAAVPVAMTAAMRRWFETRWSNIAIAEPPPAAPQAAAASLQIKDASGVEVIERALFIDARQTLFAVVSAPAQAGGCSPTGHGVILLNVGATHHIGPNRLYVELGRQWAARGYVVMRMDIAGLGDSEIRGLEDGDRVYPPWALEDVAAAANLLRQRFGVTHVTLAGICAGAYHALRAAIGGLPVDTVLLVNPLTFQWKPGSTLSDLQISEVVRNPGVYARNVRSIRHWMKLLRGHVNIWRVLSVYLRRSWLGIESTLRDLCRRLRIRIPNDLGWNLQSVAARGVRIVFVFARGDAGRDLLRMQGGSALGRLGAGCRIHVIEGADHIFTQRPARMRLAELLSSELPR